MPFQALSLYSIICPRSLSTGTAALVLSLNELAATKATYAHCCAHADGCNPACVHRLLSGTNSCDSKQTRGDFAALQASCAHGGCDVAGAHRLLSGRLSHHLKHLKGTFAEAVLNVVAQHPMQMAAILLVSTGCSLGS